MPRRSILLAACFSLVLLGCGEDGDDCVCGNGGVILEDGCESGFACEIRTICGERVLCGYREQAPIPGNIDAMVYD